MTYPILEMYFAEQTILFPFSTGPGSGKFIGGLFLRIVWIENDYDSFMDQYPTSLN